MVSVHTDCPTIERFAWQEPNHLMAPGGSKLHIVPYLPESMTWFRCTYKTTLGEVVVEVKEEAEMIQVLIQCADRIEWSFDDSLLTAKGKTIVIK